MDKVTTAKVNDDHQSITIDVPILPFEMCRLSSTKASKLVACDNRWISPKGAPFRIKVSVIAPPDWDGSFGDITWEEWKSRE